MQIGVAWFRYLLEDSIELVRRLFYWPNSKSYHFASHSEADFQLQVLTKKLDSSYWPERVYNYVPQTKVEYALASYSDNARGYAGSSAIYGNANSSPKLLSRISGGLFNLESMWVTGYDNLSYYDSGVLSFSVFDTAGNEIAFLVALFLKLKTLKLYGLGMLNIFGRRLFLVMNLKKLPVSHGTIHRVVIISLMILSSLQRQFRSLQQYSCLDWV